MIVVFSEGFVLDYLQASTYDYRPPHRKTSKKQEILYHLPIIALDQSREKAGKWHIQRINGCVPTTKRPLATQGYGCGSSNKPPPGCRGVGWLEQVTLL